MPDGVAESQGRPLLFYVDESRLSMLPGEHEQKLGQLGRILACRGDRAYLARVRPGELFVTPVNLSDRTQEWKHYPAGTDESLTFFSRLALGHFDGKGEPDDADFVFKEMFNLLNQGADRLARILGKANVLSLVGRALFFRFLRDRQIVTERDTRAIASRANELLACFDNPANAYATCQWLDRTFNGDFLPLKDGGTRALFDNMAGRVFSHLSAIVRGDDPIGAEHYQTKLKWSDFDFAHVPVGLLSQVYEAFCWKWEHSSARETSVYYTPRRIAATLVDEAFDGLPQPHKARVLDPACGAGVFLVLAFRRLYRERWRATRVRPGTKAIREILDKQLRGFDISNSALKLSALSLYLTAIELDPEPVPPGKLRFGALDDRVLFNHRHQDDDQEGGPVIGSLGADVCRRFDGQFDLVLSNPPWTSLPKKYGKLAAEYTRVSKAVIERKGEAKLASIYQNPDYAPDLPFLWKSTEWCRPGGRIAMALPARILLKQEDIPRCARETMFRLIEVTGIINGSNLSDTEVWPRMQQPFLLLFARNQRPKHGQVVRFVTPHCDTVLNRKGEVRIDAKSVQPIEVATTFDEPWLWKALAVGTSLDVEVIRRIKAASARPLQAYWERYLGLVSSNGYMVKESQIQRDASFLRGLPDLNSTRLFRFVVRPEELKPFCRTRVCWPRKREVYSAPLVLVKTSPGVSPSDGRALLCLADVAFNESFYGYSGAGHPDGQLLVRYLHLLVHSSIWLYYSLLVSPEFGAERRKIQKSDLDKFPVIPVASLTSALQETVMGLSNRLLAGSPVFPDIDDFFGNLYGLDRLEQEVIKDTLRVELPFADARRTACRAPSAEERETFRRRLESVLRPFFKVLDKEPQVEVWGKPGDVFLREKASFGIVLLSERYRTAEPPSHVLRDLIPKLADDTGTTRIIQQVEGGLLLGILNQYRYWTPSRARLLGAEIVGQHMATFER
jgi:hypothetical protein